MFMLCNNIISNYVFCNYWLCCLLCYNVRGYFVTKYAVNLD